MKNFSSMTHNLREGFTLIELLIVIAVLGVLAAVVVSAIDPLDKIAAGNDAKVIQDISVIGNAVEAYAVNNTDYPAAASGLATDLKTSGELKALPVPPTAYTTCTNYNYVRNGTTSPYTFTLSCLLKSKKYASAPLHVYDSSKGKVCNVAATTSPAACQ